MSAEQTPWWKGAAIYQIYPRSFLDTNDDGVGDLKGVEAGLDHVASLGVDAIWLSPFFRSPMADFGYDVSDYCDVDPVFGTLEDFDAVVAKAKALGLKIIIDQVYAHTSDQHAWFVESRACRTNARADWYVWADAKADGSPPNNWQSVFGGPAWRWDARRKQYYLHNFLAEQPQLNLHNAQVREALLEVARFWIRRGVDGFRLDAINFAVHDAELRDNPPSGAAISDVTRPFDFQRQVYNCSRPETASFLGELRAAVEAEGGAFLAAEIVGPDPIDDMHAYMAADVGVNTAYNFDFLYADALSPETVRRSLAPWTGSDAQGWPSWAFSNHDAPRAVSRWAPQVRTEAAAAQAAKLYLMLLLSLRGTVFLYQGEELGLPQADVPFEALRDPEAIANWPETLGRDGARTPLPWRAEATFAGFSSVAPWLPVDPRHAALAIDRQDADQSSCAAFAKALIRRRAATPGLRTGDLTFLDAPDGVLAFERCSGSARTACVFNLSDDAADWRLPAEAGPWTMIATLSGLCGADETVPTQLGPQSSYWADAAAAPGGQI